MPNAPSNRRLPWQFILLGFVLFIAALVALFVFATAVGLIRIPGHERSQLYHFTAWFSLAIPAVSVPLFIFGQRKRRRWRNPGALSSQAIPKFLFSRATRVLIGLLLFLAAYLLWITNDLTPFLRWITHDVVSPEKLQGILSIVLIIAALVVSVGGNYTEGD